MTKMYEDVWWTGRCCSTGGLEEVLWCLFIGETFPGGKRFSAGERKGDRARCCKKAEGTPSFMLAALAGIGQPYTKVQLQIYQDFNLSSWGNAGSTPGECQSLGPTLDHVLRPVLLINLGRHAGVTLSGVPRCDFMDVARPRIRNQGKESAENAQI